MDLTRKTACFFVARQGNSAGFGSTAFEAESRLRTLRTGFFDRRATSSETVRPRVGAVFHFTTGYRARKSLFHGGAL